MTGNPESMDDLGPSRTPRLGKDSGQTMLWKETTPSGPQTLTSFSSYLLFWRHPMGGWPNCRFFQGSGFQGGSLIADEPSGQSQGPIDKRLEIKRLMYLLTCLRSCIARSRNSEHHQKPRAAGNLVTRPSESSRCDELPFENTRLRATRRWA